MTTNDDEDRWDVERYQRAYLDHARKLYDFSVDREQRVIRIADTAIDTERLIEFAKSLRYECPGVIGDPLVPRHRI